MKITEERTFRRQTINEPENTGEMNKRQKLRHEDRLSVNLFWGKARLHSQFLFRTSGLSDTK